MPHPEEKSTEMPILVNAENAKVISEYVDKLNLNVDEVKKEPIVIEGVLQTFDQKHQDRVYPPDELTKKVEDLEMKIEKHVKDVTEHEMRPYINKMFGRKPQPKVDHAAKKKRKAKLKAARRARNKNRKHK